MSDEMIEAAQVQRMERLNRDAANERIVELTDAFNKVCAENADFVAESIKTDRRIAELEANIKTLRKSGIGLIGILEEILYAVSIDKSCNARVRAIAATLEQQIKAVREGK